MLLSVAQIPESVEPPTATQQSERSGLTGRPTRLDQVWTIVSITAGVVFVVALIRFSGLFLGRATHGPYGGQQAFDRGGGSACPMMGSDGGMGPGMMGPGGSMPPQQATTPTRNQPRTLVRQNHCGEAYLASAQRVQATTTPPSKRSQEND